MILVLLLVGSPRTRMCTIIDDVALKGRYLERQSLKIFNELVERARVNFTFQIHLLRDLVKLGYVRLQGRMLDLQEVRSKEA